MRSLISLVVILLGSATGVMLGVEAYGAGFSWEMAMVLGATGVLVTILAFERIWP